MASALWLQQEGRRGRFGVLARKGPGSPRGWMWIEDDPGWQLWGGQTFTLDMKSEVFSDAHETADQDTRVWETVAVDGCRAETHEFAEGRVYGEEDRQPRPAGAQGKAGGALGAGILAEEPVPREKGGEPCQPLPSPVRCRPRTHHRRQRHPGCW